MSLDSMPTPALVKQRGAYLRALVDAARDGVRPWWAEDHARRVLALEAVLDGRGVVPTPRPM